MAFKRARARRFSSRRRTKRTRRGTRKLATVAYVKKLTAKTQESKRTTVLDTLTQNQDVSPFAIVRQIGLDIAQGTSDKGRIGTTIRLTGINVRWVIKSTLEGATSFIPTLHIVIVEPKNNWGTPGLRWYKAFDNGLTDPYEPLNIDSANDGRRWMNTDDIKIHKYFKKRLKNDDNLNNSLYNGNVKLKLNKTMTITHNGSTSISPGDVSPVLYVYAFVTYLDVSAYTIENEFELNTAINTYYKD